MTQGKTQSPWSPLRNTLFRNLWIASIVSNLGTWMHDVGAGWLMTSLSSSPSMVALVEAADSLPVMLLAMPAGAPPRLLAPPPPPVGGPKYFLLPPPTEDAERKENWTPVNTRRPSPQDAGAAT